MKRVHRRSAVGFVCAAVWASVASAHAADTRTMEDTASRFPREWRPLFWSAARQLPTWSSRASTPLDGAVGPRVDTLTHLARLLSSGSAANSSSGQPHANEGGAEWVARAAAEQLPVRLPDLGQAAPTTTKPAPANAWDIYVAAAKLLRANGGVNNAWNPDAAASAEEAAVVERNRATLRLLRQGFTRPYSPPKPEQQPHEFRALTGFRNLSRLLACETEVLAGRDEYGNAAQSCLDGVQLARDLCKKGVLIYRLVGIAMEAISLRSLKGIISHLSAGEAAAAAKRLTGLDKAQVSLVDTLIAERAFSRTALAKAARDPDASRDLLPDDYHGKVDVARLAQEVEAYFAEAINSLKDPYYRRKPLPEVKDPALTLRVSVFTNTRRLVAEATARRRLVIVALALQAYRRRHGRYPETLAALSPAFLPALPSDTFHDGPLFYRRDGNAYRLYSAGPDCDDDGGKPLPRVHGAQGDGDLVWNVGDGKK